MSRSLTAKQVRALEALRAEMAYHHGALDELHAQAADVVDLDERVREAFADEQLWNGFDFTAADVARWADDAESNTPLA